MSHHEELQPWTVLASEHLHREPWLTLRRDSVRLPSGAVIKDYYVLEYPAWVNILAITPPPDERFVLVRQYRHGLGTVHAELPGGVVDPADADPLAAARRELLEETGYGGGTWSPLTTLSANAATHANLTHSFLARGVTLRQPPSPDSTEDIRVHLVTRAEAAKLVLSGGIIQSLHAAPLLKFLLTDKP